MIQYYDSDLISEYLTDKFKEKKKVEYAYHSENGLRVVYKIKNNPDMGSTNMIEIINWLYKRNKQLSPV